MDMKESAELGAFRAEVREWVNANKPSDLHRPHHYAGLEDNEVVNRWYRKLGERHWLAYRWPKRWGGAGFSPTQQIVFADELRKCGASVPRGFGVSMVGPLILEFGSDAQRERFLPPIAEHTELWCQGYSEPNSGSDLASLQTRAEDDGAHLLVNGQKIWTSRANLADWIFALVRTSSQGPQQRGISFLLVDMKTPGSRSARSSRSTDMPGFSRPSSTTCASPRRTWSASSTRAGVWPRPCWPTSAPRPASTWTWGA